jgi:hypothetical protein
MDPKTRLPRLTTRKRLTRLSPILLTADVDVARPFRSDFGWNDHTKLMFPSGLMKLRRTRPERFGTERRIAPLGG